MPCGTAREKKLSDTALSHFTLQLNPKLEVRHDAKAWTPFYVTKNQRGDRQVIQIDSQNQPIMIEDINLGPPPLPNQGHPSTPKQHLLSSKRLQEMNELENSIQQEQARLQSYNQELKKQIVQLIQQKIKNELIQKQIESQQQIQAKLSTLD